MRHAASVAMLDAKTGRIDEHIWHAAFSCETQCASIRRGRSLSGWFGRQRPIANSGFDAQVG
jgi:hypothetical protein